MVKVVGASLWTLAFTVTCALESLVRASPFITGAAPKVNFQSEVVQDGSLRFVRNSGVCETTPGVQQLSGYIDVGKNMSMWFWFFAAREKPETAPFTLWLNGGPGCSSMIGLFQENGPCNVNPDGETTVINPYSWNTVSNMIYIDQPIGTGFSYGMDTVNSTEAAAPFVWKAFQILFESGEFKQFASREFIFATESYGGHYGPAFVTYFDQQNTLIQQGKLKAEKVVVSALMINNGWYDPLLQNKAYVDFATNAPGYGPIQNATVIAALNEAYYGSGGCQEQETACQAFGIRSDDPTSNAICLKADNYCIDNVFSPAVGDLDSEDLRQSADSPDPFPPEYYLTLLKNETIKTQIGAETRYGECPTLPYELFRLTGDDARSWLPQLSSLVNSKLKVLIWAGDADINCNWLGGHASVLAMDWYGKEKLNKTAFTNMTVDGQVFAAIQNVDNFSFARVYGAGHEVPAYKPEGALAVLKQIINKEQLHSV